MKKLILAFSIIFTTSFGLADDLFVQCMTQYPSTSFSIETSGDTVTMSVLHHNGIGYAPFWNSLIVPSDITKLQERANLVMKLAPELSATWKKSACKLLNGNKHFICMGATDKIKSNGIDIDPWAVYSSTHSESSFAGDYEHTEVAFRFYVNNEANQFVMKYQPGDCLISDKK